MTTSEHQQLLDFLGRQFTEIDRRFAVIDQRFVEVDRRLVGMDQRFDARFDVIEHHLRDILGHFDEIYRCLERLEQEYQAITQALRRIEGLLVDERARREILERSVQELKQRIAELQERVETLERQIRG